MTAITGFSSSIATALDGLRRAERVSNFAAAVAGSGSLDPNTLATAATVLQGAETTGAASALALEAGIAQQRRFIDILA